MELDNIKTYIEANIKNQGNLVDCLEHLGKLPNDTDISWTLPLLEHSSEDVRFWAIKTIGKIHSLDYLSPLVELSKKESSTMVRREIASSIGRLRSPEAIPAMIDLLSDKDPKVVCQAIRGLLYFKGMDIVDTSLKALQNHPNDMISKVISTEFFGEKTSSRTKDKKFNHPSVHSYLKNVAVNGDVLEVLKSVPEDSVHLTFTSPPYYNARDYSIYESYEAYLSFLEEVFKETYRITKEGRFLILNTSPVIVPRISRAYSSKRYPIPFDLNTILQKMGWEFIDDIIWMKPEYSVKNRVGGFDQHRKPLGYKPNCVTEYLMVYRKSTNKLIDWNMHQYSPEIVEGSKVVGNYETTNVWQINPKSDKVHSAIFPEALCERVVRYYSFKGDIIFDPFGGSGTLARVAKMLGRNFFTTEKDPTYFEYMKNNNSAILGSEEDRFVTLSEFIKIVKNDTDGSND